MNEAVVPEDILPDRIQGGLRTKRLGQSLEVRAVTDSTMDDARAVATTAPDGHVVLADRQARGRGAHGRTWESPEHTDLYFSVVARGTLPAAARPLVTLAAGLGVAEAVEGLCSVQAQIKWPNDVWVRGRKCAGILVEASSRGEHPEATVIGVGLNVNRRRWPEDLRPIAVSLAEARGDGEDLDRAAALAQVLEGMERWLDRLAEQGPAPVVDGVARRLALVGEEVEVDGLRGVLEGIGSNGALRLRTAHGVRELLAGTLRRAQ